MDPVDIKTLLTNELRDYEQMSIVVYPDDSMVDVNTLINAHNVQYFNCARSHPSERVSISVKGWLIANSREGVESLCHVFATMYHLDVNACLRAFVLQHVFYSIYEREILPWNPSNFNQEDLDRVVRVSPPLTKEELARHHKMYGEFGINAIRTIASTSSHLKRPRAADSDGKGFEDAPS